MLGKCSFIAWAWVWNTENGTLIIKKLRHILSIWNFVKDFKYSRSARSQTKKCQRLFLCYQYAGEIRLKNRMRMRTMFAEIHDILIVDWQCDELEIPLKGAIGWTPRGKKHIVSRILRWFYDHLLKPAWNHTRQKHSNGAIG